MAPTTPPITLAEMATERPTNREMRPPYSTRVNSSRPSPSVPSQCAPLGPCRGLNRFSWSNRYCEMNGTRSVARPIRRSTMRLAMASLWRLNRRSASCRVERMRSWRANGRTSGAETSGSTGSGWVAAGIRSISSWSRIADPRVKDGVHDIGHQVEDDHEEHCDHHPRQDLLVVPSEQGVHEIPAHPGVLEDGLGDDQAPGDGPYVDGNLGGQGDQGVAHGVPDDHPALLEALGPGRAQVVAV